MNECCKDRTVVKVTKSNGEVEYICTCTFTTANINYMVACE
ncbi:hypothetical protein bcgnr5372_38450 [Bacillus luti]